MFTTASRCQSMTTPDPRDPPRPDSPVWISRFEWPSHDTSVPVPGMGFGVELVSRFTGEPGISPAAAADEREVARFVAPWLIALFPVGSDGRPLTEPTRTGDPRRVCSGGAEILLTNRRMAVVVVKGYGKLGKVDEREGSIIAIDVPYRSLGSVAIVRKKKILRSVSERSVRCRTTSPPGGIDVEPLARLGENSASISFTEFADTLIRTACDDLLTATLMEAAERHRVERLRQGARESDGLDVVAEIAG